MNKVFLSKSKYRKGHQCKKILWLEKYKQNILGTETNNSAFKKGNEVGELAKGLFGDYEDVPFDISKKHMIKKTNELMLNKPNIITEASFSYDNNFCSVDILKNDEDGVEFYEVKSSKGVKPIHKLDAAYQYYVLNNIGLNVKKVGIVHLDENYKMEKELNINKLFHIEDVTSSVKEKQKEIKNEINEIREFMEKHDEAHEPSTCVGKQCCDPHLCVFWKYCAGDLPKPNVFDVYRLGKNKKFDYYHNFIITFEDLYEDECFKNLSKEQQEQIEFEVKNLEPRINKKAIKKFLSQLKGQYPLSFLDYETLFIPIPVFNGTYPYRHVPFQFSLHIQEKKGGPLKHEEFLADIDEEDIFRTFAKKLMEALPEDGKILVYNDSFESARNREIGKILGLDKEMKEINDRMVDLMVPFKERHYYTKEMQGSASLKYVLPALYPDDPELDYSNLTLVHNADEAPEIFLSLKDETLTEEEKEYRKKHLREYCKLDTYALYKILKRFEEVTKRNSSCDYV